MDSQVAIVGGGPVGLGLAIDLALAGVSSVVLERATKPHRIPKGQNLTQRTGEHFRRWGIGADVRAASPIPASFGNAGMVAYGTLLGDHHYDWFKRSAVAQYYFAENERLPQYRLETVLRDRAAALPQIDLRPGARVTKVTQDAAAAKVTYEDATGTHRVTAAFAVGCDGARSTLRAEAGIELQTDHSGPKMALLVFRSMALHALLERFPGKSIYNVMGPGLKGYWQFLGRVDLEGGWFFHAPVPDDTTAENFDFRTFLHDVVGAPFDLEFEHIGFWDLRIQMAKTYANGRLFIAGDAAHSHPPYGGYGINTGLEDARNLSWKLTAHLDGWAGPGLLDSYTAERLPVFASTSDDFIHRMIRADRAFTEAYDPARDLDAFTAAWQARATQGNDDVTQFLPHYAGSPLVFGPPGAASGAKGQHSLTARAGYHLAPQELPQGDLWDLMGAGFTLINRSGHTGAAEGFALAANNAGVPFTVIDADPQATAAWEAPLILVRPDLFVAWAGDPSDAKPADILDTVKGGS